MELNRAYFKISICIAWFYCHNTDNMSEVVLFSAERKVVLTATYIGQPDFYMGQTLKLTCEASGFTDIYELMLRAKEQVRIGCMRGAYSFAASRSLKYLGFSHYEDFECTAMATGKYSGYTISTSAEITPKLDGVELFCQAYDTKDPLIPGVTSEHLLINNLKGMLKYYIEIINTIYSLSLHILLMVDKLVAVLSLIKEWILDIRQGKSQELQEIETHYLGCYYQCVCFGHELSMFIIIYCSLKVVSKLEG